MSAPSEDLYLAGLNVEAVQKILELLKDPSSVMPSESAGARVFLTGLIELARDQRTRKIDGFINEDGQCRPLSRNELLWAELAKGIQAGVLEVLVHRKNGALVADQLINQLDQLCAELESLSRLAGHALTQVAPPGKSRLQTYLEIINKPISPEEWEQANVLQAPQAPSQPRGGAAESTAMPSVESPPTPLVGLAPPPLVLSALPAPPALVMPSPIPLQNSSSVRWPLQADITRSMREGFESLYVEQSRVSGAPPPVNEDGNYLNFRTQADWIFYQRVWTDAYRAARAEITPQANSSDRL